MKYLIFFLSILIFAGCQTNRYTSSRYFDCPQKNSAASNTDLAVLIKKIIERDIITEKDIPDYRLIADKEKIYIRSTAYAGFAPRSDSIKKFELTVSDIPMELKGVRFCLKSPEQLKQIADDNEDFIYLAVADFSIRNDTAVIGLYTQWQAQSNSRRGHLSGGGYGTEYVRKNGEWVFSKILFRMQS